MLNLNFRNIVTLSIVLILSNGTFTYSQNNDLVKYVNTFQGTNSSFTLTRGNTYPTTALPFAMQTWTPQTGVNGDGWKYQFEKDSIRGFQQAHQCSSTITLEDGKKFIIQADDNSTENVYINSAKLNGSDYTKNYIKYKDIVDGGVLHLKMTREPNINRGVSESDKPFSVSLSN